MNLKKALGVAAAVAVVARHGKRLRQNVVAVVAVAVEAVEEAAAGVVEVVAGREAAVEEVGVGSGVTWAASVAGAVSPLLSSPLFWKRVGVKLMTLWCSCGWMQGDLWVVTTPPSPWTLGHSSRAGGAGLYLLYERCDTIRSAVTRRWYHWGFRVAD